MPCLGDFIYSRCTGFEMAVAVSSRGSYNNGLEIEHASKDDQHKCTETACRTIWFSTRAHKYSKLGRFALAYIQTWWRQATDRHCVRNEAKLAVQSPAIE